MVVFWRGDTIQQVSWIIARGDESNVSCGIYNICLKLYQPHAAFLLKGGDRGSRANVALELDGGG